MPKRRDRSPRSRSSSYSRRRRKHHHRSPKYRSRSRPSQPNLSPHRSLRDITSSHDGLLNTLREFVEFIQDRNVPALSEAPVDTQRPASFSPSEGAIGSDRPSEVPITSDEQLKEQVAHSGHGGVPGILARTDADSHVTFVDPPTAPIPEVRSEADTIALELFGDQNQPSVAASWTPHMLTAIKSVVRSGLNDNLKNNLLTTYESKNDLAFLVPPRINKEILPNLGATALARDRHQIQSQMQLGASLNAIGSGLTELLQLDFCHSSTIGRTAITRVSDGIRLLADLHFRLSQSTRAFIVPSLNFLGKTASDSAPIDDCLFGSNFAEDVNAAQTVEKVARKMARQPPHPPNQLARKPGKQPFKQQANQPFRGIKPSRENSRPPLRRTQAAPRPKRGYRYSSRSRRSASRSRARYRR